MHPTNIPQVPSLAASHCPPRPNLVTCTCASATFVVAVIRYFPLRKRHFCGCCDSLRFFAQAPPLWLLRFVAVLCASATFVAAAIRCLPLRKRHLCCCCDSLPFFAQAPPLWLLRFVAFLCASATFVAAAYSLAVVSLFPECSSHFMHALCGPIAEVIDVRIVPTTIGSLMASTMHNGEEAGNVVVR